MLEYLVVLLDDTSASYCAYEAGKGKRRLMDKEVLQEGLVFALKENLHVQFVYPPYELPQDYQTLIESVEHSKIQPSSCADEDADVVVFDGWKHFAEYAFAPDVAYILRTGKDDFFRLHPQIAGVLGRMARLSVVITDVETFGEADFDRYRAALQTISDCVKSLMLQGQRPQINLLTDRLLLAAMNNCNAGWKNIALAPDGRFYPCPAFYRPDAEGEGNIGSLSEGLHIRNAQLYRLEHAPICRMCDAYQCRRCIWLNQKTTWEVNTPSHEQCVVAHLEREASRLLLSELREGGCKLKGVAIEALPYWDPFEIAKRM